MRCPVCRAEVEEAIQCRRCRADLSLLVELEKQRRHALTLAQQCLRRGRYQPARALSEGAETLRRDDDTRRLCALTCLLQRDFTKAWEVYRCRS
jgi:hypothetical protein